jgi:tetratricopeptide (TPR) repeat protein
MAIERQAGSFFISFASHDHSIAAELVARLQERQFLTFFAPRDIAAGENFALRIVQGIVECDTIVVLLSAPAICSPHVRREVSLAIDERRQLIPVTLPGTRFPEDFTTEWSYWLSAVQVLGFTTVDELVEVLISGSSPTAARVAVRPRSITPPSAPLKAIMADPISPVSLLRPEHAVVPFAGRQDELARLISWLDRNEKISVRLVIAPGGHGKSRIAQQLADQAGSQGWNAEFIRDLRNCTPPDLVPALWVVDYAETKGPELAEMIEQLARASFAAPLRLLLLARGAGDWWRALSNASVDVEAILDDAVVQELAPLTKDPVTAAELYFEAVNSFANALGMSVPDAKPPTEPSDSLVDLMQSALLAVLVNSQRDDSKRVIQRLLGHERRYVRVAAVSAGLEHFDDVDFDRIAALFSLFPPQNEAEAVELAGIAQPAAGPQDHVRLVRVLRRVYPGTGRYSSGLKPDVVAELAISDLLAEDGGIPGGLKTWALVDDDRFESGLRVLARAAVSAPSAKAELKDVVGVSGVPRLKIAMDVALQVEAPEAIASAIASAIRAGRFDDDLQCAFNLLPEETVALSEVGAVLAERLIANVSPSDSCTLTGGSLLVEASSRFSDAGWNTEALKAVSAGITELRRNQSQPARLELGRALSNLSNRLWETGALDASLAPAAEAVELLASAGDRFALLGARNNLAFRYIEAGRYDDAREQCELALDLISEEGRAAGPMRTRALAVDNNLVCLDAATGTWARSAERAAALIEERRSDYAVHRDRHMAYLARALANAAVPFAGTGDTKGAAMAIAEARVLHRITAARAPIFSFEASESALIDAVVHALAGSFEGAGEALTDARRSLEGIYADVTGLAGRLSVAISAADRFLAVGTVLNRDKIAAVGGAFGRPIHFPLLLEYKDL